jgi:[glutamine synthetase] adenylyltransferase / [glutamine synthetase]-adenylyl-L-tyrosine phosphorylase
MTDSILDVVMKSVGRLVIVSPNLTTDVQSILQRSGTGIDRLPAAITFLVDSSEKNPSLASALPVFINAAANSADPAQVLNAISSVVERAPETQWNTDVEDAHALASFLAGGTHLVERLSANPDWYGWLSSAARNQWSRWMLADHLKQVIDAESDSADASELDLTSIRRWHEKHLARIAWSDLAGTLDIAAVTAELAALADVAIDAVGRIFANSITERYGPPTQHDGTPARWSIIGLGKLGGNELNFRSDIDLMFVYSDEGESPGGRSPGVSLYEWFSRWSTAVSLAIGEVSPTGMLYEVDARLRPDGSSGALARSVSSYIQYYETRGEVWERQMLIKARPVAGDHALGETLIEQLEPFIFPRSHSLSPREEIRHVKERILAHLVARDASFPNRQKDANLKLRRGGLRDIEFIVQCLQLVVGGADRAVRIPSTLTALEQMQQHGVLTEAETEVLTGGYRFYRRIEHRLQMSVGRRSFQLPQDDVNRQVLARRLGYEDVESFMAELERVRQAVTDIYDDVLGSPESPDDVLMLLDLPVGSDRASELLLPYCFRDAQTAHRDLLLLAYGHTEALAPSAPKSATLRLVPRLLEQLGKSSDPDAGLSNLERMLRALGAVESFSDMLASHPRFLELLVTLCSGSQSLTDWVLQDPALIDWMLYSGVLLAERSEHEVDLVLGASVAGLDDTEQIYRAIHAFRKQETLRVGLRYLLGIADDEETGHQLSAIADAILRELYCRATEDIYAARGTPLDNLGQPTGLIVIALGKLGSSAMNFGSDLDVMFVHGAEGETDRGKANIAVFSQVAQRIMSDLSEPSKHGLLYEVDARLRPEGRGGPLSISANGYARYLETRASTWERQALTRARMIAGPEQLCRDVTNLIDKYVYASAGTEVIDEVESMRERMEESGQERHVGRLNIKTGSGGLVDAEFMAQLGQVLYGGNFEELCGLDTAHALGHLQQKGLVHAADARSLIVGYRMLRNLQMRLRIRDDQAHNVLPPEEVQQEIVARTMGSASAVELRDMVEETMSSMRTAYIGALSAYREGLGGNPS